MKEITEKDFGLIIAFLLPGFLLLWGLSFSYPEISSWLSRSGDKDAPAIAGFLYASLASLAVGLIISAVRWLILDHLYRLTGVAARDMDFSRLTNKDRLAAFLAVVENHYRYYQYYSNTLISVLVAFVFYFFRSSTCPCAIVWISVLTVVVALFFGSRDALKKYYNRAGEVLG